MTAVRRPRHRLAPVIALVRHQAKTLRQHKETIGELLDERVELRRQTIVDQSRINQLEMHLAAMEWRAEVIARMEDHSWCLAIARGDQLRRAGITPAGTETT